jgi:parvulin-like peptidyl-prolyl isomerase
MEIVAQVFDVNITKTELDFVESLISKYFPDEQPAVLSDKALNRLIDKYLILHEATLQGICIEEIEFEDAMLDMLDQIDTPQAAILTNRSGRGELLERLVRSDLIVDKYLERLNQNCPLDNDLCLQDFYNENIAMFTSESEIRVSHILIKGNTPQALAQAEQIRNNIQDSKDFNLFIAQCHDSDEFACGDLGFFPRGVQAIEIENIAFGLELNEISQPVKTHYGYHILMLTEKKAQHIIAFESIKDSLRSRLSEMRLNVSYSRLVSDLRLRFADSIRVCR